MKTLIENKETSKDVRRSIVEDISKSIFIDAGAGAGKTTSIVGRVLAQIKAGISPKRIIIITFTNKATEEIQTRISAEIYKKSKDSSISEEDRLIYKDAFNNLSSMNISTIHSFCYTLLNEKSLNIKLPIGVILDEDIDVEKKREKLFNLWFKTLNKNDYDKILDKNNKVNYKDLNDFYKIFLSKEDSIYDILNIDLDSFKNIFSDFNKLKDLVILYANEMNKETGNDPEKYYSAGFIRILSVINNLDELDVNDIDNYINGIDNKFILAFDNVYKDINATFNKDLNGKMLSGGNMKAKYKEIRDGYNVEIDEFKNNNILKYLDLIKALSFYAEKKNIIEYAYKAYLYYKDNRGNLNISNDQLLYLANEVMKNDEARIYFANKYDCIYVDEFQDTDHIQAEMIWTLTKEIDRVHKEKGQNFGSLVVVGDPKQSIYRFRGADPDVFFKIKEEFKERDSIIYSLNYNFRSNNLILDYVNDEFKEKDISGSPYNEMLYDDTHIVPSPKSDLDLAGVFQMKGIEGFSEEDNVSTLIKTLIDKHYRIPKYNKNDKKYYYKEIEYSDFLVLFGNFKNSNRFIKSFKKYNIPVSITGRLDFLNSHGMKSFLRLFKGLVSPQDKLSKMGAIESLRMNGYNENFNDEVEAFNFYNDLFNDINQKTKGLSAYAKALYLANHLELIVNDTDSVKTIYMHIMQSLENAYDKNFLNGVNLANYFEEYFSSKISDELSLEEDSNSIRFMNAHKSKGLEANIVIWVNNGSKCALKDNYLKDNNKFIFNLDADLESKNKAILENDRENGRLEYVCATRAMNLLIFTNELNLDNKAAKDKLFFREGYDYHLDSLDKYQVGSLPTLEKIEIDDISYSEYKPFDLKLNDNLKEIPLIRTSPSLYEIHEGRNIGKKDNIRPTGNILGTAMHRALELLVLKRIDNDFNDYPEKLIDSCIIQALNEGCEDIYSFDRDKYYNFLHAVLVATVDHYKNKKYFNDIEYVEPELKYTLYDEDINSILRKDDSKAPIYLNGTMDLFIKYKDSILIIDYKSDFKGYQNEKQFSNQLKSEYQNQLNIYKESAKRLFSDINKIEAKIIYFKEYDGNSIKAVEVEI